MSDSAVQLALPATIPLNRGLVALVDAADAPWLSLYRWRAIHIGHTWYAVRDDGERLVYMHREILRPPVGMLADHADGNGLNNTRGNLRLATEAQNRMNARSRPGTSSRYRGVDWCKSARAWRARVWVDGQERLVGYFESEEEAATARARAARSAYGEFMRRCDGQSG